MFLLDTNVCIRFLEGRSQPLRKKFQSVAVAEKCLCSVVAAELLFGAAKSQRKSQTLAVLLPFIRIIPVTMCNSLMQSLAIA